MLRPIETVTDLIQYAAKHGGEVDRRALVASGLGSIGAVAAELRRRGYEVDQPLDREVLVIVAPPHVGAKRRLEDQTELVPPTPARPAGYADPET